MSEEVLDLGDSHTRKEVPVRLDGKNYLLREADGPAILKYKSAQIKQIRVGEDGKRSVGGDAAETEPLLISMCMFDADGKNVPLSTVKSWPNRIQKRLLSRVKEISDIDQPDTKAEIQQEIDRLSERLAVLEENESKNEQVATTIGSL